jgi:hypothetical protein
MEHIGGLGISPLCATTNGMPRKSPLGLPKSIRVAQEKRTITLRISFASVTGKESDEDAERFRTKLEELLSKFNPKSDSKYTLTEKNETRRGTTP